MSFSDKVLSIFQRDLLLFVTNLFTGIILARTLGPTVLGIWMILTLVPAYAESFGRLKADVASVYLIGQETFRREDILFNLNLIALASASILLVVIFSQFEAIYDWLFRNEEENYRTELFVLIIQIPLQFFCLNYSYFHIANENIYVYNRMLVIQAWVNSITVITLLSLTSIGLWAVIFSTLLSILLALLYGWKSINRKDWVSGHMSGEVSLAMIKYAVHFYLVGILGQLRQSGTNLIAVSYLLPTQIAFLGQGQIVGRMLLKLSDAFNTVLYPRISKPGVDAVKITCVSFRITSILLLFGGLILAIVAEPLIILLYGEIFRSSIEVLHYLLPGLVIAGNSSIILNFFNGSGRANMIPRIQIFPVLIQMLLAWQLIQLWGLIGAVISITIGMTLYGLMLVIVFIKVTKISVSQLIPGISDFRYIILFATNRLKIIFGK